MNDALETEVKRPLDRVHALLEAGGQDGEGKARRVVLDLPEAWVTFAARPRACGAQGK